MSTSRFSPGRSGAALSVSLVQESCWRRSQREPDNPTCIHATLLRLQGKVSPMMVQATLQRILDRHQILTMAFPGSGEEPMPSLSPRLELPVPEEIDLADLSAEEQYTDLEWMLMEAREEPFDLGEPPLFRCELYRLSQNECILLLLAHRLLFDEWSSRLFQEEFATAYNGILNGVDTTLPELPLQYMDYSRWQRENLEGGRWDAQAGYWRERLSPPPPPLNLPAEGVGTEAISFQTAREVLELPGELRDRLVALCAGEGVSLDVTLLAAFAILLYMYSGQHDITVGTPSPGRPRAELERLIGPFGHVLPLRTDLSSCRTFRDLLGHVADVREAAFANQDLPVDALWLQGDAQEGAPPPWLQVLFRVESADEGILHGQDLDVEAIKLDSGVSCHQWDLGIRPLRSGLRLTLAYNTDQFDAPTVAAALGYYRSVLEQAAASPGEDISRYLRRIADSDGCHAGQAAQLGPTNVFVPFGRAPLAASIPQRFQEVAARFPDRLAVTTRTDRWTYDRLNRSANRIAHALAEASGDGRTRIALLFSQNISMLAALLGALKAGQTYVPLDISSPALRLREILQDAGARTILTTGEHLELATAIAPPDVRVLDVAAIPSYASDANPVIVIAPDSPAYLIYTSGSTGRPKGVAQTHRNVLHFIGAYTDSLHIAASDTLTQLSSHSFDAAVMDIYGALLNGAGLCSVNLKEESLHDATLRICEEGASVFHSTPTVFRYFMGNLAPEERLSGIRLVVLGGETVTRRDVEAFKMHFDLECLFVNLYGSTESSLSLLHFMDHRSDPGRTTVPAGYPVVETGIVLLDQRGNPTPLYGEIGIRSPYLTLGYWGQDALTRSTFVDDQETGLRLYRTGDIGRLLPDGSILCCGRKDFQVKLRGYRVELSEVEAALSEHVSVDQCAVVVHEDERQGEPCLVAFFTTRGGTRPSPVGEIEGFLKERLPGYMIPSNFSRLEAMPLTPTGKIDRRRLGEHLLIDDPIWATWLPG